MENTTIKINPKSDLYRICPKCGLEFIAEHRSRKFCSEQHHDDFNNALKKKNASALSEIHPLKVANSVVVSQETNIKERIAKNIAILSHLVIDLKQGTNYNIMELLNKGFDFAALNFRFLLFNTNDSYCLQYGSFKVYRITPELVLICKNQKNELFRN
jgi:ribosomal protein S27AE